MTKHTSHFIVKIGGQNMPEAMYDELEEVIVDTRLNLPGMFSIRLHDAQLKWVDDSALEIGKEVEISAQLDEEAASGLGVSGPISIIKGEITALEPDFAADGKTRLVLRGYDKMHRLHRGRKTQTFLNVSDSDLVKRLAGNSGVPVGDVDSTSIVNEYVIQYNQTNMEFLMSRAARIGYQLFVSDGKLNFKKGAAFTSGGAIKLAFLESLTSFEPRWTASHQADKMIVKGWDARGKKEITGQAVPVTALNQGGMQKTGGDFAKTAFSAAEDIIVDRPVSDQSEAESIAKGLSSDISREFIQAEGECFGHPQVKAGCKVKITGVGTRFSGDYLVTSATHVYTPAGYQTRFSISGLRTETLASLLQDGSRNGQEQGLVNGIITGLVTNLNDPDNLGRVKVKYAWLGNIESDWARLATPMAGSGRGWMFLPEVNDEVVMAFEHGDIHRPYIIGALWNTSDNPPKKNNEVVKSGKVAEHILKSRSGHIIILDDSDGQEKIVIRDKTNKNEIIIDSKTNTININTDTLKLNLSKDLASKAQGNTTLETTGELTLKSTGNLTIECQNFKVDAKMNADLKANVAVNVQNAAAKVALSGPTVNINNGALEVT